MDRLSRQSRTAKGPASAAGRPVGVYVPRSICSPTLFTLTRSVDRPCGFRLGPPRAYAPSSPPSARLLETCSLEATPAVAPGDSIVRIVADGFVLIQRPAKTALQQGDPRMGDGRPQSNRHDTSTGCSEPWGLIAPSPSHLGRVQRHVRPADGCQLRAVPAASVDAGAARGATGPHRGSGQQGANRHRIQGYVGRLGCPEGNRNTEMGGGGDQFAPTVDGGVTGRPRSFSFKPNSSASQPYPDLRPRGMLLCAAGGDVELTTCPPALPPPQDSACARTQTTYDLQSSRSFGWRSTTATLSAGREDSLPVVHRDRNGQSSL